MLEIRLLGDLQVLIDGAQTVIRLAISRNLLCFLALHPSQAHDRAALAARMWPDRDQQPARDELRRALNALRKDLGAEAKLIRTDKTTIALDAFRERCMIDVHLLRDAANDPNASTEMMIERANRRHRELLPGIEAAGGESIEAMRVDEHHVYVKLLDRIVANVAAERRRAEVDAWAAKRVALDPVEESGYASWMRACAALNDSAAVVRIAEQADQAFATADLPPALSLRALARQLSRPHIPNNLAPPPHELIGRDEQLEQLLTRVRGGDQLITLIGAGGVGKTRLAQAVAERALASGDFPDGVFFVALAASQTLSDVIARIADALKLRPSPNTPPRQQLLDFTREKSMLIVLDNLEHLLAAQIGLEELLDAFLKEARGLRLLATTRAALHSQWERQMEIVGLDYPEDPNDPRFARYGAVALFEAVANSAGRRPFSLAQHRGAVIEITRLVRGMPLALRMAAARAAEMPCDDVRRGIEQSLLDLSSTPGMTEAEARHRDLRAVVRYSWVLLKQDERAVFARLCVMPGSFTLNTARQIGATDHGTLLWLVDKSFVQFDGERYDLHPLLREFGAEQLPPDDAAEAGDRMVRHFLDRARDQAREPELLRIESANLLGALRLAQANGQHEIVIELGRSLGLIWWDLSAYGDLRAGMPIAATSAATLARAQDEACFHLAHGRACTEQSDYDEAQRLLQRARAASHDAIADAQIDTALARVAHERGEFDAGIALLDTAIRTLEASVENSRLLAEALYVRARLAYKREECAAAVEYGEKALQAHRFAHDDRGIIATLCILGTAYSEIDDHENAVKCCADALTRCDSLDDQLRRGEALYALSQVECKGRHLDQALKAVQEAHVIYQRIGSRKDIGNALVQLSWVHHLLSNPGPAVEYVSQALAMYRQLNDDWSLVRLLYLAGYIHQDVGETAIAICYWQEGLVLAERVGHTHATLFRARLDEHKGFKP